MDGRGPRSLLLELSSGSGVTVRILVDCGWDRYFHRQYTPNISKSNFISFTFLNIRSQFREASLAKLKEAVASPIDLVLLSFGDLEHCGALPLLCRLGLKAPFLPTSNKKHSPNRTPP